MCELSDTAVFFFVLVSGIIGGVVGYTGGYMTGYAKRDREGDE